MTPEQERLAQIVSDAEGLGYLDPKYAEVMHARLAQLLTEVQRETAVAQADSIVAKAEVRQLEDQRDAVRTYLGDRFFPRGAPIHGATEQEAIEDLRTAMRMIVATYSASNQKIMAIKETRLNLRVAEAWVTLGGTLNDANQSSVAVPLRTAKDLVDNAFNGWLLTPQGTVQL